jgi:hypothetical protein
MATTSKRSAKQLQKSRVFHLALFELPAPKNFSTGERLLMFPAELKLHLLGIALPLVLDVEYGVGRDRDAFPGDLDPEPVSVFQGVGETPELGSEIPGGIAFFQIPVRSFFSLEAAVSGSFLHPFPL